jgi:large subunit ribosomal protein L7Ae
MLGPCPSLCCTSDDPCAATEFFKLASKYMPETKAEKKERHKSQAAAEAEGDEAAFSKKATVLKYGINHITSLVESKKAQLVVIAHDVDPIEIVAWLPALCRKMEVPYAIVKSKSRLGKLVHKKTATAVAFTSVSNDDRKTFTSLVTSCKEFYSEKSEKMRKEWGGNIMGQKSQNATRKREKALEREAQKKAMAQF